MFHFSHPILLLCAIPAWYLYRRVAPADGLRGAIRFGLFLLLIAMAAGPIGPAPEIGSTLVLVFDQSQSMPTAIMSHKSRLLAEANSQKRPNDRLGVIKFGATALVEQYPDPDRPPQTSLGTKVNAEQTNLHMAIAAALQLIPERSPGRILVVSDGQSDDEIADELLAQIRRRGIAIDFEQYPSAEQQVGGDLVLQSVKGACELNEGDELRLQYRIVSESPATASLHIRRDNEAVATLPLKIESGTTAGTWSERCDRPGVFRYSLTLLDANDPMPGNNSWELWVRVRGAQTVLVVNATGLDTPMVEILRAAGVPVQVIAAAQAVTSLEKLSGYSACVLEDVGLGDFPSSPAQAFVSFVEQLGGGLIVTGGDRSFGTGGYRSSLLEPLLPVALRPLNVNERLSQALVVLADPAAWDAQNRDAEQVSPVQQALLALTAEMDPADRIGLVATRLPEPVVLPLTVVGSRDVRETIAQLGFSSDQSSFPHALGAAWDILSNAPQAAKHLLVVMDTDHLALWPPPQLDPILKRPTSNASVTLVTWGSLDSTTQIQWRSRLPSGRVFSTSNIQELAGVLRQDWELNTGGSFVSRPTAMQQSRKPLADASETSLESLPVVDGFHTATRRDRATGILSAKDIPTQPLVARWDRGLGRVCTVLFRVRSAGADNPDDERLATLLAEQVTWAARTNESESGIRPITELADRTVTVRLQSSEERPRLSDALQLQVTRSDGLDWAKETFVRDGSGSTARFKLEGSYSYLATTQNAGQLVARCLPVVLPRSSEFLKQGTAQDGHAILARLAHESGGTEWRPGAPLFEGTGAVYRSLVPALAWCALVLLVIDVADRRYQVVGHAEMRWGLRLAQRRRKREEDNEEPSQPACDPFELAKERMRRRVQR